MVKVQLYFLSIRMGAGTGSTVEGNQGNCMALYSSEARSPEKAGGGGLTLSPVLPCVQYNIVTTYLTYLPCHIICHKLVSLGAISEHPWERNTLTYFYYHAYRTARAVLYCTVLHRTVPYLRPQVSPEEARQNEQNKAKQSCAK